jgi:phosphoribosylformylglycinamidine synthase
VRPDEFKPLYRALAQAIKTQRVASAHGVYRGGLGVHLAMVAMGGCLGLNVDLNQAPRENAERDDIILFSESAGRFIVTLAPSDQADFESLFIGKSAACIGTVTKDPTLRIRGLKGNELLALSVEALKKAWKRPFGSLI